MMFDIDYALKIKYIFRPFLLLFANPKESKDSILGYPPAKGGGFFFHFLSITLDFVRGKAPLFGIFFHPDIIIYSGLIFYDWPYFYEYFLIWLVSPLGLKKFVFITKLEN